MPAISTQIYGAAVSGIQSAAPTRHEYSQARQSEQSTPPFSVELSNVALREQNAAQESTTIAPELLKALNNDITRTSSEMSEAITDNHLHIQGMFSKDASSSFNFFGVSMPLAASSFKFPSVQSAAPSSGTDESGNDTRNAAPAPPAPQNSEVPAASDKPPELPSEAAETQTAPAAGPPKMVPTEKEIVSNSQQNVTMDFDNFSAQLSGMAMAATASPASAQASQR